MALHYLTVQDVLWINLQVTKKVQSFDYANLEEAVFYQYAYGKSTDLFPQAARFLHGFIKKGPLAEGNEETAFLGCLAFLKINGADLNIEDATAWLGKVREGESAVEEALQNVAHLADEDSHHHGLPDVRAVTAGLLAKYPDLIAASV